MENTWMELSYNKRFIASYTPKPIALISCIASTFVAIGISQDKAKMGKMYHRLALGMCISSSFNSFNIFLASWSIPYKDDGYIHAWGTIDTCTASGFFIQLGFIVQFYYVSLSVYVFMALRCEFKLKEIAWIEKYLHLGVFIFPLSSAIYLCWMEMFNPVGLGCYVNSYPQGCKSEKYGPCVRGPKDPSIYSLLFIAMPTLCNLVIATAMIVACYVNEQIKYKRLLKSGRLKGKQVYLERARQEKSMLIAMQRVRFLCVFYLSYLHVFISTIVQMKNPSFFPTILLSAFLFPLDGFMFTVAYFVLLNEKEVSPTKKHSDEGLAISINIQKKSQPSRVSFSIFEGTDEEKWKMFGVYVGSDSDSLDDYDVTNDSLDDYDVTNESETQRSNDIVCDYPTGEN